MIFSENSKSKFQTETKLSQSCDFSGKQHIMKNKPFVLLQDKEFLHTYYYDHDIVIIYYYMLYV